eukprot:TRINITY_DN3214_c0_g1_i1.p1 TRINITY_DN3214_c0_g1~~TRINITY_DN3214_c0_g1_i1.p1  ORF type:complete len:197 (-),score=33.17 TRINITY_DN3214_c0_g1_i1:471-1061(-)
MAEYSRVYEIYESLTPRPKNFLIPTRFFVREGPILLWNDKEKRKKKRYLFLFNDTLLITKPEGKRKYWLRVLIALSSGTTQAQDTDYVGGDYPEFRLHCRTRAFAFFTVSLTEKQIWIQDINAAIKGEHDARLREKKNKSSEQIDSSVLIKKVQDKKVQDKKVLDKKEPSEPPKKPRKPKTSESTKKKKKRDNVYR